MAADQTGLSIAVIDQDQLKAVIQTELNAHRNRIGQVDIGMIQFEDGAWRAILRSQKQWPTDYAVDLAEIEEKLVDRLGLNVILIPASD